MSREELVHTVSMLEAANKKLAEQNMKLVLLAKEKDQRLFKAELVIRRYRTRLVRWFEDMVFDPLESAELDVTDNDTVRVEVKKE